MDMYGSHGLQRDTDIYTNFCLASPFVFNFFYEIILKNVRLCDYIIDSLCLLYYSNSS